ncbi:zinc-dependent alcohol dehydrogenase [Oceanobacillus oncorhynchi]|uniref:zinc-dependent alcohol dehydrogenase n=1 Tax=Oceanobacillus oncorhynchi TaxID=545501 RepID=UPI001868D9CA|nr:zinc-binding dehydrogenase [Oceanobacillus oncorhynchi]
MSVKINTNVVTTIMNETNELELSDIELKNEKYSGVVEVSYNGICGTDLHISEGKGGKARPVSIGHEFTGRVIELNNEILSTDNNIINIGDRVTVVPGYSCGNCFYCRKLPELDYLCENRVVHGMANPYKEGVFGGLSTKVGIGSKIYVQKIPDSISDEIATLIEPLTVAIRAVERAISGNRADIDLGFGLGSKMVVFGLGTIGLMTAMVAQEMGLRVVGIEPNNFRRRLANETGISVFSSIHESEFKKFNEEGADIVIEAVGKPKIFKDVFSVIRKAGRFVVLGHFFENGKFDFDPSIVCRKDIEIIGSVLGPRQAYPKAVKLMEKDPIRWNKLITHIFPLTEVNEALEFAKSGECMKVIVKCN